MSPSCQTPLLQVRNLVAGYQGRTVLHDLTINIFESEIVAVIGYNGSGKSTLLKSIFGIVPLIAGEIDLLEERVSAPSPRQMLGAGVAYMPQGHRAFDDLTVLENLEIAATILPGRDRQAAVQNSLELFDELKLLRRRRCRTLSGGERQMLGLAAALLTSPKLLLLDEPSLGLSPRPASLLLERLVELNTSRRTAILIVEQRVRAVLAIAHRAYLIKGGRVAYSGSSQSARADLEFSNLLER